MNSLSKLLVRVAVRVMTRNPTNAELLATADRVVTWRNADYITDEQVDEIAAAVPEEAVPEEPTEEPAAEAVEPSDEAAPEGE